MYINRILKIKEYLLKKDIDAYICFIGDDHGSEYINDRFKIVSFLSGFTGSNGILLITKEKSYLWTDGRYFLQAKNQLEQSKCILMKMGEDINIIDFICKNISSLCFDYRLANVSFINQLIKKNKNINLINEERLIDLIWDDRPKLPQARLRLIDQKFVKVSANKKCYKTINKYNNHSDYGVLVSALDDIAYLCNLRGKDIKYNPVFMSYMFLTKVSNTYTYTLYVDLKKITESVRQYLLDNDIKIKSYNKIYSDIKDFKEKIYYDKTKTNYKLLTLMSKPKNSTLYPSIAKAIKNNLEIKQTKKAHILDGVAMVKFIYYVKNNIGKKHMDEIMLGDYLMKLRKKQGAYDLSFATICAYKENGAIVHYNANNQTNKTILNDGFLLIDSGGQYDCGTTDITRTLAFANISEKMKYHFTLVLKAHIRLAKATFAKNTLDSSLDYIARKPLWDENLDYNHGTGHGVGHMLNVHEGPISIRYNKLNPTVMKKNMITSNEPGLYFENLYGIRHENEMLCVKVDKDKLGFVPLTYVPFDLDAIDSSLLDESERKYLNNYHCLVYNKLEKYLNNKEKNFLKKMTREI